jgi:hypothetical protein
MNELRQAPRFPMSGPGKIIVANERAPIDCTVREISTSGACLEVAADAQLPEIFMVIPDDDHAYGYACRVIWRTEALVGIKFD